MEEEGEEQSIVLDSEEEEEEEEMPLQGEEAEEDVQCLGEVEEQVHLPDPGHGDAGATVGENVPEHQQIQKGGPSSLPQLRPSQEEEEDDASLSEDSTLLVIDTEKEMDDVVPSTPSMEALTRVASQEYERLEETEQRLDQHSTWQEAVRTLEARLAKLELDVSNLKQWRKEDD